MKHRIAFAALLASLGLGVLATRATLADSPSKSQWNGVYATAQANRGDALYSQYCAACHGSDLLGGEIAPQLIGGAFQANWNNLSLGDLFERINTSMPQNAPGSLSRQQVADILAYMLAKDSYPAGQAELPVQTEALKEIKFLSTKP